MTHLVEHEVGDIHDVVDRTLADGHQAFLEPVRRRADLDITQRDADIARRQIRCLHLDGNRLPFPATECGDIGQGPFHGHAVAAAPGIEVARHTDVAGTVHPVGRQADFEKRIFFEPELFAGRRADHGGRIQHHDAGMVVSDAQFIFRADHAEAVHAADAGFLDLEFAAVVGRELRTDGGQQDFLALRHVGRTADHLHQLGGAGVEPGDVEMVGIGMFRTFDDFRHDDAGEAARNLFHSLHVLHFQAGGGKGGRNLLRRQVKLQVILQPIKRDIHIANVLFEQGFDKLFLVEELQVFDLFTDADELDGDLELVADADHHAAFG